MSDQIKSGIYVITNTVTGDCYIGSSIDIDKRLTQHRALLRLGQHHSKLLQAAWNEYGEGAFVFDVLEIVPTEKDLIIREQQYLDERNPKYNPGKIAIRNGAGVVSDPVSIEQRREAQIASVLRRIEWENMMNEQLQHAYEDIARKDDLMKIVTTAGVTPIQRAIIMQNKFLAIMAYKWKIVTAAGFLDFLDSGFKGLYGGKILRNIATLKRVPENEVMEHMEELEFGANFLRNALISKYLRERESGTPEEASGLHYQAGQDVRQIFVAAGIPPEELPTPSKSYKQIVKDEAERIRREEELEQGLWNQLPPEEKEGL